MIAPHLFPKLKEKKDSVCNAALAALRALFTHCLSLSEMMDELLGALSHKTPKVQMLSLQFLAEHFPKAGKQAASKVQKDLFPAILQNLEHSTPEVRDAAVQATVGFCKAVGSAGMIAKHVNNIEDSKRKKLEEALASQLGMGPRARSGQSQQMDNQAKTAERYVPFHAFSCDEQSEMSKARLIAGANLKSCPRLPPRMTSLHVPSQSEESP